MVPKLLHIVIVDINLVVLLDSLEMEQQCIWVKLSIPNKNAGKFSIKVLV